MQFRKFMMIVGVFSAIGVGPAANADITMEWATVGDVGNTGELSGVGYVEAICGAVDYEYLIGKYEVTNGQYVAFLNAVAAVGDPNGLYNTNMGTIPIGGIARTGSGTVGDPYVYGPKNGDTNWLVRPVNLVSYYDTLRFANWMHNGQPVGAQDASTTEDGAYDMSLGASVVRKPGARVFLPTEDEWYKAAYYKGGGTDAGYWDYATQSDTIPTREAPPGTDMVNGSALYDDLSGSIVGPPYGTTAVGAYSAKPSTSPYGLYDQNGNVQEWQENIVTGSNRCRRGASFVDFDNYMVANSRYSRDPLDEWEAAGFRVAAMPDPVPAVSEWGLLTMTLVVLTAGTVLFTRRRHVIAP